MIAAVTVLTVATPALAHRTDEYLQATTLHLTKEQLRVEMRLVPGVSVVPTVLGAIDADRDGAISDTDARAYGAQVLADLALRLDETPVPLRLLSWRSDDIDAMRRGLGEIQLVFEADLPAGGASRRMVFENHHRSAIAAYLVNSLVPSQHDLRITHQRRDYRQSVYELEYAQGQAAGPALSFDALLRWGLALGVLVLVIGDRLARRSRHRRPA
jgi:hypothetical protein